MKASSKKTEQSVFLFLVQPRFYADQALAFLWQGGWAHWPWEVPTNLRVCNSMILSTEGKISAPFTPDVSKAGILSWKSADCSNSYPTGEKQFRCERLYMLQVWNWWIPATVAYLACLSCWPLWNRWMMYIRSSHWREVLTKQHSNRNWFVTQQQSQGYELS